MLALVSAEKFWGDLALVMGAVLVLFSLMRIGMTKSSTTWMTVIGASLLTIGTTLTIGSDIGAYAKKHPAQGALASLPLIATGAFVSMRFFRAVRAERVSRA